MSTNYALAEGNDRGFVQIPGQKKATGGGTGMAYGDLITYVRANDQWEKAGAASVRPFGFCGVTDILTKSTDELTGVVTATRGVSDAETHFSVIVKGFIKRKADGVIPPGEYVMPSATAPLTEVVVWNGTSGSAVIGRYVRNITQHDNNQLAATVDGDDIIIDFSGDDLPETGTGA